MNIKDLEMLKNYGIIYNEQSHSLRKENNNLTMYLEEIIRIRIEPLNDSNALKITLIGGKEIMLSDNLSLQKAIELQHILQDEWDLQVREIIFCECDCGCATLQISKFEDDISIECKESFFYSKQNGIFRTIKERLKMIWCIITGKEYRLWDITISPGKAKELARSINKFII